MLISIFFSALKHIFLTKTETIFDVWGVGTAGVCVFVYTYKF